MKEVKAIVKTASGTAEKTFKVSVERNGNLYSPEMFDWIIGLKDRVSNLFTIQMNGRNYTYGI